MFETKPAFICGTFPSAFPAQKRGFKNVVPNGSKWQWGHSKYVSWAPKIPSLNHPCLYKMAVDVSSCWNVSKVSSISTWHHFMKNMQTFTSLLKRTRTSGSCGTSVFETKPAFICGTFPSAFPAQKRGFKNVVPNGSKGTEWP